MEANPEFFFISAGVAGFLGVMLYDMFCWLIALLMSSIKKALSRTVLKG